MKFQGMSSVSMARFRISPRSITATCTTLQMPSQMDEAVPARPWKNPAMASMAPCTVEQMPSHTPPSVSPSCEKNSPTLWATSPATWVATSNAAHTASHTAVTASRNSSQLFHSSTTAAMMAAMAATTGCAAMSPSAPVPSLPTTWKAAPIFGTVSTTVPTVDSTGPMAAAIVAIASTAVWPPSPMPANHSENDLTTPATLVAMLSSGSPSGSMEPCSSRMASCDFTAKLSEAASWACCAAPATSPKLSCTPARDSIMPMALSSPSEDHRVEASAALSYSFGICVRSPSTACSMSSAVALPFLKFSKTSCVPSLNEPMDSSMRPSDSAVRNSLR